VTKDRLAEDLWSTIDLLLGFANDPKDARNLGYDPGVMVENVEKRMTDILATHIPEDVPANTLDALRQLHDTVENEYTANWLEQRRTDPMTQRLPQ
jgi:hypothetical protein